MAAYIRRYKGSAKPPVVGAAKSIDLAGAFSQWQDVTPEYHRDNIGDTYIRNHPGYNTVTRNLNTSGRNDLVLMKVARDRERMYFYARTADQLTEHSDPNWMMLFIDADRNRSTGWHGYDYVVNRRVKDSRSTFLEHTRKGWGWQPKAEVAYWARGNELMISILRKDLGVGGGAFQLEFKWADNIPESENNVEEFTLDGDAAPPGRFNYLYIAPE